VEARAKRTLGGRRYDVLRETLDILLEAESEEENER
jgi:hypothetical protein